MLNHKQILILGANSDMAIALCKELAKFSGNQFMLASRNMESLQDTAQHLQSHFSVTTSIHFFDVTDTASHENFYANLPVKPDMVIFAAGLLGNQEAAEQAFNQAHEIISTNFTGAVSILEIIANDFCKRQRGMIIGISSVAGERGRCKNYFYGAAKAGFTAYLSGLRNRLYKNNCHVMTVLPGYIKTKMIDHMQPPSLITATPTIAAKSIIKAMRRKRNKIYVMHIWRYIIFAVKSIPEPLFKRLGF